MMEQSIKKLRAPQRILIFNSLKKLVGFCASQNSAAKMFSVSAPAIKKACDGDGIAVKNHYFRVWDPVNVDIDIEKDWGVVTVTDYDELVGRGHKYYDTKSMTRKSLKLKYNMKATPEKIERSKRYEKSKSKNCQQIEA